MQCTCGRCINGETCTAMLCQLITLNFCFSDFKNPLHFFIFFFQCFYKPTILLLISVCTGIITLHIDKSYCKKFFIHISAVNTIFKCFKCNFLSFAFFVSMLSFTGVLIRFFFYDINIFYSIEFIKN